MDDRVTPEFAQPVQATERMAPERGPAGFRRRCWFAVTLAAVFVIHASLLALLFRHDDPVMAPVVEDTPVEVVAQMPEPPKPPPEPVAPKPAAKPLAKPPAAQPPEKPATSAPRAQNDEKADRDAEDSESRAPSAAPSPPSAPSAAKALQAKHEAQQVEARQQAEAKSQQTTTTSQQAKLEAKAQDAKPAEMQPPDATPEKAAAPPDDASQAEALDKAVTEPPPVPPRRPSSLAVRPPEPPARPGSLAMAEPRSPPRSAPTAIEQLAGNSDLPDYVFAKPQRKPTKYKGGSEDNRYLAVVYAMVTQSHEGLSLPGGDWQVAVAFEVDGHGNLVGLELTQSSGYPQVDAAAVEAVRSAAPFPPPPSGGPTGLIARLSAAHARAAQREAERARGR